jgi:hypothetical protein
MIQTSRFGTLGGWMRSLLAIGSIFLIWAASIYLVNNSGIEKVDKLSDLVTLFFGAASLALFVFSIFIALLAVFGWQTVLNLVRDAAEKAAEERLKNKLEPLEKNWKSDLESSVRAVEKAAGDRVERLEKSRIEPMIEARLRLEDEMKGRALSILGFTIGESSLDPETLRPRDARDRDNLAEAIRLCEEGYRFLEGLGEKSRFMGLNNLVFYSCAYGYKEKNKRKALVEQARLLRDTGRQHKAPNLQLTACRAILEYGTDPVEKEEATQILEDLLEKGQLSPREQREANVYMKQWGKSP